MIDLLIMIDLLNTYVIIVSFTEINPFEKKKKQIIIIFEFHNFVKL